MPIIRSYNFRKSTDNDLEQIEKLLYECFGGIARDFGALNNINNRYMLAEYRVDYTAECVKSIPKIVAITGILPVEKSDYSGYEITWTCTSEEHRKRGLIVKMLKRCEASLPDDNIPLYCDCWRIADNENINLSSVMKHLGMKEVVRNRINRKHPYNKECKECLYKKENCFCCGDLYMKNR